MLIAYIIFFIVFNYMDSNFWKYIFLRGQNNKKNYNNASELTDLLMITDINF